jgi:Family of unknown function (DUF5335)
MTVRDIPESEWPSALEEFSQDHHAWLTTVERIDMNGSRHVEAIERPLSAVTPEMAARRIVGIAIQFQPDSHGSIVHVDTPTHLRVDQGHSGSAHALEIEDARGERTRIRFRNTPPPEALDGVAPGELA